MTQKPPLPPKNVGRPPLPPPRNRQATETTESKAQTETEAKPPPISPRPPRVPPAKRATPALPPAGAYQNRNQETRPKNPKRMYIFSIAAALSILVAAGVWYFFFKKTPPLAETQTAQIHQKSPDGGSPEQSVHRDSNGSEDEDQIPTDARETDRTGEVIEKTAPNRVPTSAEAPKNTSPAVAPTRKVEPPPPTRAEARSQQQPRTSQKTPAPNPTSKVAVTPPKTEETGRETLSLGKHSTHEPDSAEFTESETPQRTDSRIPPIEEEKKQGLLQLVFQGRMDTLWAKPHFSIDGQVYKLPGSIQETVSLGSYSLTSGKHQFLILNDKLDYSPVTFEITPGEETYLKVRFYGLRHYLVEVEINGRTVKEYKFKRKIL